MLEPKAITPDAGLITVTKKEIQVDEELEQASAKAEAMLKNIVHPKLLPTVMMCTRAVGRWTPRPVALWIGRKIAAKDDEPKPTG